MEHDSRKQADEANLPAKRTLHCVSSFWGGPFDIKVRGARSNLTEKKCFESFVCMVTKSVHLELAEDLVTAKCIQAFLQFTSIRQGAHSKLWSNHRRNFIGAEIGENVANVEQV